MKAEQQAFWDEILVRAFLYHKDATMSSLGCGFLVNMACMA